MTALVKELLNTFDRLTDSERLELLGEILKRTVDLDFPPLSDEDLVVTSPDADAKSIQRGLPRHSCYRIGDSWL